MRGDPLRSSVVMLWTVAFLVIAGLPDARADSERYAEPPPSSRVPVILQSGKPGVAISIQPEGDASLAQTCSASCNLALAPGTYKLTTLWAGERSSRRVHIYVPQRLVVTPPDSGNRDLGAGLAISGLVIGGLGSALFLYGAATAVPCAFGEGDGGAARDDTNDCNGPTFLLIGAGGMATGLALGIPGVVLLLRSERPQVDIEHMGTAAPPVRFHLGLGSGSTLAGLTIGARF